MNRTILVLIVILQMISFAVLGREVYKAIFPEQTLRVDEHTKTTVGNDVFADSWQLLDGQKQESNIASNIKNVQNIAYTKIDNDGNNDIANGVDSGNHRIPEARSPAHNDVLFDAESLANTGEKVTMLEVFSTRKRPLVCIGTPVTSRKIEDRPLREHPLIKTLVQSFVDTAEPEKFDYALAIGYDEGDPVYDDVDKRTKFKYIIGNLTNPIEKESGTKVKIFMKRFSHSKTENRKSVSAWVAGDTMQICYDEGADYLFRVNDDIKLISTDWTSKLIETLASRTVPNLGMACPDH